MKRALIISYVPPYNRQGYDLALLLQQQGYRVSLLQADGEDSKEKCVVGVRCIPPHGRLHTLHVGINLFRFVMKSFWRGKDVVICIGRPSLVVGMVYKLLFRVALVYYALEYISHWSRLDRWAMKHCVDGVLDVEENRLRKTLSDLGINYPSLVLHNMPLVHEAPRGGALKSFLKEKYGIVGAKLAIYAGSNQQYACLDKICEAAELLPEGLYVVFMTFGMPEQLVSGKKHCVVVPPVRGDEFYNWLADADCSLLPYESKSDFNVKNCSPQKIFDCYVAGVPYVASDCPLVHKTLKAYPDAGSICDFTDVNSIQNMLVYQVTRQIDVVSEMRRLHIEQFNYNVYAIKLKGLIDGIVR